VNDTPHPVAPYDELRTALVAGFDHLLSHRARRRRRLRALGIVCGAALLVSGLALAATTFIGSPAPTAVKSDLVAVDAGMPAALRMNPDVRTARSVASTGASTLWLADLAGGGRCLELTTTYYPDVRAPGCETGARVGAGEITATLPNDDRAGPAAPVVIAGQVRPVSAASLSLVVSGGRAIPVAFGAGRFYVADITGSDAADIREHGVVLVARDPAGAEVARVRVPPDWDAGAAEVERATTVDVTTRSDESDFTKVLGIDGFFRDPKPASLELVYDAGHAVAVPLAPDGSFHYDVAPDRQGDFMTPRHLIGRDADGRVVVDRAVAAVAYWRSEAR
jgi:hypothetical protein